MSQRNSLSRRKSPMCLFELILAFVSFCALATVASCQTPTNKSITHADIREVRKSSPRYVEVKVRFANPWAQSVYLQICDTPPRLTSFTTYLERLSSGRWQRVVIPTRNGIVQGDLAGSSFELKPGTSTEFPYVVDPVFMGVAGAKLRLVVLTRTRSGSMGAGIPSPRFVTKAFKIPLN